MGELVEDLEKLAELHKAGILSADELKIAVAKRIASGTASPAAPSPGTVTCTQCHSPQDSARRFCGRCSAPLIQKCSFCFTENSIDVQFCSNCGNDVSSSPTVGLPLPRAQYWRSEFQHLGWWDSPTEIVVGGQKCLLDYLQPLHLPTNPDDLNAYWIFCSRVRRAEQGIEEVLLNDRAIATGWRETALHYLVGTRESIIFFNLNQPQAAIGKYTELQSMESRGKKIDMRFTGMQVTMRVNLKGAGFLNFMMGFADDPAARLISRSEMERGQARQRDYVAVVGGFLDEVWSICPNATH